MLSPSVLGGDGLPHGDSYYDHAHQYAVPSCGRRWCPAIRRVYYSPYHSPTTMQGMRREGASRCPGPLASVSAMSMRTLSVPCCGLFWVLCCAVLCCAVLCCACCAVLCRAALYQRVVLCRAMPCCAVPCRAAPPPVTQLMRMLQ